MTNLKENTILMAATYSDARIRELTSGFSILSALQDICVLNKSEGKKLDGNSLAGLIFDFTEPLPDCKITIQYNKFYKSGAWLRKKRQWFHDEEI